MRRPISRREPGWWKATAYSVAASAWLHVAGITAVVAGGFVAVDRVDRSPEWGVIEVTGALASLGEESYPAPPTRPDLRIRPLPAPEPVIEWEEPPTPDPNLPDPPEAEAATRTPPPEETPTITGRPLPEEGGRDSRAAPRVETTAPVPIDNPPPDYPGAARRMGYEGVVILAARVSPEGRPVSIAVTESSGHPILDRAAMRAVRGWSFRPAVRDGKAVEWELEIPIRFRIGG